MCLPPNPEQVNAGLPCTVCKYVVTYVDALLKSNQSEAQIEAALEKVCKILPGKESQVCENFVKTYASVLAKLIVTYGTPDAVCKVLKMCNSSSIQEPTPYSHHEYVSIQEQHPEPRVNNDVECTMCKYVISYINVWLQSNVTDEKVEKALEFVCVILPDAEHAKCLSFIKQYGPILIQLVAELDDPNMVCEWLNLCPKPFAAESRQSHIIAAPKNINSDLICTLCEYVVNYLDATLASNKSQEAIEEALDKVCTILPEKERKQCVDMVQIYGPVVVQLLIEFADPPTVCKAIDLCPKAQRDSKHLVVDKK